MELNYNRVELRGVAEDAPLLSHVNDGCAFYRFTLSVLRLSGQADKLPVIVPRPLLLLSLIHILLRCAVYIVMTQGGRLCYDECNKLRGGGRLTVCMTCVLYTSRCV